MSYGSAVSTAASIGLKLLAMNVAEIEQSVFNIHGEPLLLPKNKVVQLTSSFPKLWEHSSRALRKPPAYSQTFPRVAVHSKDAHLVSHAQAVLVQLRYFEDIYMRTYLWCLVFYTQIYFSVLS